MITRDRITQLNQTVAKAVALSIQTFAFEVHNGRPWTTAELEQRINEVTRRAFERMNSGELLDLCVHNNTSAILAQAQGIVWQAAQTGEQT